MKISVNEQSEREVIEMLPECGVVLVISLPRETEVRFLFPADATGNVTRYTLSFCAYICAFVDVELNSRCYILV